MYLKRSNIPKFWPVPRKGTKYLAVASHNQNNSIPLVVVMRDLLKIAKNKKEVQRAINEKKIKINQTEVHEVNYPVCLFDVISLPEIKKNYKAVLSKGKKIVLEEIKEKESETKVYKIINKKKLSEKVIQLNLMYGRNIISKEKSSVGDSVVFNLKENKIEKIIPMEKGREVFIFDGKHAGVEGKIEDIIVRGGKNIAKIISKEGKINVWLKNLIAVN